MNKKSKKLNNKNKEQLKNYKLSFESLKFRQIKQCKNMMRNCLLYFVEESSMI